MRKFLAAAIVVALAACSFQNKYERQADGITRAVMNNDLRPVANDLEKGIDIPRVRVAEWSDELNAQGKLLSVKEVTTSCDPGWHCFDVKFEKHVYVEHMLLDENGKVVKWNFHMMPAGASS